MKKVFFTPFSIIFELAFNYVCNTEALYVSYPWTRGELERINGQPDILRIKAPGGWDRQGIGRRLYFFPGHFVNRAVF